MIEIGSIRLYNIAELAETFGVSELTLRNYVREGRLKGRKVGKRWFVSEQAIRDHFGLDDEQSALLDAYGKASEKTRRQVWKTLGREGPGRQ